MEDLIAGLSVGSDRPAEESQDEHPHFSLFKNEGKFAENQRQRREEHLQRQNNNREQWLERRRNIEKAEEEQQGRLPNAFAPRRKSTGKGGAHSKNPYANCLMHSDWLIDIPETLSTEWTLIPSPVGRRCLVVAQNGNTTVYNRNGRPALQFESALPGGNSKSFGSLTMLDCICSGRTITTKDKFYALDMLWWSRKMYTDTDFTMRQFFMRSKLEELALDNAEGAGKFVQLPQCPCSPEAIANFMQQEFPYRLDGLLFYYNSAYYIPEQTPLVGWLKPWMLPEILGVPIPERYIKDVKYTNSKDFIAEYNQQHGHTSSAEKASKGVAKPGGSNHAKENDDNALVVDEKEKQTMAVDE